MLLLILVSLLLTAFSILPHDRPIIRGVLFYEPDCQHCENIIDGILKSKQAIYGSQLQIILIDVSTLEGSDLFQEAVDRYNIPPERQVIPLMIVGEIVLAGGDEITLLIRDIIQDGLAVGGYSWPRLSIFYDNLPPKNSRLSTAIGFTLGGLVLSAMLFAIVYALIHFRQARKLMHLIADPKNAPVCASGKWAMPGLCLVGLALSGYLTYMISTQSSLGCTPFGGCSVIQTSPYGRLFGIPVSIIGIFSYASIALLCFISQSEKNTLARFTALGIMILPMTALLFSTYLTYVEIFILETICTWCLVASLVDATLMIFIVRQISNLVRIQYHTSPLPQT
jgi:uncharacterized membrane protein